MAYIGEQQQLNKSAFGELLVVEPSGRIQLQFLYNVNSDLIRSVVTGGGNVSSSTPFALLQTTASPSSSAKIESLSNLHYRNGQGAACLFTSIFSLGVANSQQYIGIGDDTDGFFFGYNGTSFGILHRNNSSDTWIPQNTWNFDKFDGTGNSGCTLDPQKGNVYKIQFQWLGFGAINFFIECQTTGEITQCHQIRYSNSNITTSISNPSLPLSAKVINTSNSTNIVLKTPSMSAFLEGSIYENDIRNSQSFSKSGVTTELNILTIRNNPTFVGVINKKVVILDYVAFTNTGVPDSTYKLYINPTVGGTPVFQEINNQTSVVSYDTAGTTVSGSKKIFTFFVSGNSEANINLSDFNIILNPGDRLVCTSTSSGAAIAPSVSFSWKERF